MQCLDSVTKTCSLTVDSNNSQNKSWWWWWWVPRDCVLQPSYVENQHLKILCSLHEDVFALELSLSLSLSLSHKGLKKHRPAISTFSDIYFTLSQQDVSSTGLIKHESEKDLTLCGCESCLWFPCVRSHGWLQRTVTPSPLALSASAW